MFKIDARGVYYFPIGKTLRLYPWDFPPIPFQGWDLVRSCEKDENVHDVLRENIYFDKPRDGLERAVIHAVNIILAGADDAEI